MKWNELTKLEEIHRELDEMTCYYNIRISAVQELEKFIEEKRKELIRKTL